MDIQKVRAWWHHRQGLDGSLAHLNAAELLSRVGWQRSVGGANPYIAIFARNGQSRESIDTALATASIHELPSARGCTYVLPAQDYALGLKCGEGFSTKAAMQTATRFLGYTQDELNNLCVGILKALESGPMDPRQLKDPLGNLVRNFGDEGKKRGQTTSLSLGLGVLQEQGKIRRIPIGGRIDQQRYAYALWSPSPLDTTKVSSDSCYRELAMRYFEWIGPATIENFQWFTALSLKSCREVISDLDLVPVEPGSPYLFPSTLQSDFKAFECPSEPSISLISGIDCLFLLRRNITDHLDPANTQYQTLSDKKFYELGSLADLSNNAIVDRGELIGLWEFDPDEGVVVFQLFVDRSLKIQEAVASMQTYIRDQLGDARSFSLDSPTSRRPKLDHLRNIS